MIAVVEAVTAPPDLRDWLMSLAALARRAADRHVRPKKEEWWREDPDEPRTILRRL
jgi:hypothetical protein